MFFKNAFFFLCCAYSVWSRCLFVICKVAEPSAVAHCCQVPEGSRMGAHLPTQAASGALSVRVSEEGAWLGKPPGI